MISFTIIPQAFFFFVPLQTGAEIISGASIFNKASALYGLGALFTGHPLSPMEWILNLFSIFSLPLMIWGFLSIRKHRPLRSLAFAYIYFLDVFVSLGFTIYFIVHWFAVGVKKAKAIGNDMGASVTNKTLSTLSSAAMASTAVLMDRSAIVPPSVSVVSAPTGSSQGGPANVTQNKSATVGQELATTIVLTTLILLCRFYFMLVIVGYARRQVRLHNMKSRNGEPAGSSTARLQYVLIRPLERFWTGSSGYVQIRARRKEEQLH